MFCVGCGRALDEGAQFCPACGAPVNAPSSAPLLAGAPPSASPALLTVRQLTMVWDKLSMFTNYRFQDASGRTLGATQGEIAFPIRYTLLDEDQNVVLTIDATRAHGLRFDFLIHDSNGIVLGSIRQETSVLSRRYGLTVGGKPDWLLTTDAMGYHYQIETVSGGIVVATGDRKPAIRTSTTAIQIAEGQSMDHRVILGAMILAEYFSTRK